MNNLCIMNSLRHIPANSLDGCNPFEVRVPSVGTNHNILTEGVLLSYRLVTVQNQHIHIVLLMRGHGCMRH